MNPPNEPVKELKPCTHFSNIGNTNYRIGRCYICLEADLLELQQQSTRSERLIAELVEALRKMHRDDYEIGEDPTTIRDKAISKAEKYLEHK